MMVKSSFNQDVHWDKSYTFGSKQGANCMTHTVGIMATAPRKTRKKSPPAAVGAAKARSRAEPRSPATPRSHHYHVYVIELSDEVWNLGRFRRANPDYQLGKPFVYVGMTGLDPDVRFDKHKAGVQANGYVLRYGVRLLPGLYAMYNPMPYEGARDMEVELGIALRELGYGVWQA